jgi:hypothetical protein
MPEKADELEMILTKQVIPSFEKKLPYGYPGIRVLRNFINRLHPICFQILNSFSEATPFSQHSKL